MNSGSQELEVWPRLVPSSYETIRHFFKMTPKIFIKIFNEYLRAKLQVPVLRFNVPPTKKSYGDLGIDLSWDEPN